MGIIYGISIFLLLITFMLIKKTDKKLNFISFTSIGVVIMLCYNALICYILTFVTIPTTLLNLTIINIIFTIILGFMILKKREIQKYNLDKMRTNMCMHNFNYYTCSFIHGIWFPT